MKTGRREQMDFHAVFDEIDLNSDGLIDRRCVCVCVCVCGCGCVCLWVWVWVCVGVGGCELVCFARLSDVLWEAVGGSSR